MTDSRPTIGHVLHRLDFAGAAVIAADLARGLQDRFRSVFLCLDETGPLGHPLRGEGFKVVELKRRRGLDLRVAHRLRRETRRYALDLLHAHQYTPFLHAALSRCVPGGPRKPFRRQFRGDHVRGDYFRGRWPPILFTEHGRDYPDLRRVRRVIANRFLLRPTDRVTAVGNCIRQALADHDGIDPGRTEIIHNGIDLRNFGPRSSAPGSLPTDTARAAARAAMGVRDGETLILQVAQFSPVKDHVTAVEAFARVAEQAPDVRLVFIGDGERRAGSEAAVRAVNLQDRVTFLGVRDDVHRLLAGADMFLLSSLSEGVSLTLLEAMAARLPIVATQVGGNPELVDHGRNGLLAQRADAAGLAHNLLMLVRDPQMRRNMGEAGHNRVLKLFTQEQMHAGYERMYREMLDPDEEKPQPQMTQIQERTAIILSDPRSLAVSEPEPSAAIFCS